jgi:hypothetical protein
MESSIIIRSSDTNPYQCVRRRPFSRSRDRGRLGETKLGHANILRLVHEGEIERRPFPVREMGGQPAEHIRSGHRTPGSQPGRNPVEDRPQRTTPSLRQASLPSQTPDVMVLFPRCQLPGIHHLLPLLERDLLGLLNDPAGLFRDPCTSC